jgi:hypothetical protein
MASSLLYGRMYVEEIDNERSSLIDMLKAVDFEDRPWKIGFGNSAIKDLALEERF